MKEDKRILIQSYLKKYLTLKNPLFKLNYQNMFECPFKDEHTYVTEKLTCKLYVKDGHRIKCMHSSHNKYWTIFDVVRKYEAGMENFDDNDIGEYLIELLDIQTNEETDKLLNQYLNANFCLIPVQAKGKAPIQKEWQHSENKNIVEWKDWIENGLNIGLNLGKKSKVIAIDVDSQETFSTVRDKLNETLIQTSAKGFHFLYEYEPEFDSWGSFDCRKYKLDMEFKSNGTQIVIAPSSTSGEKRFWNDKKIAKMSPELKRFLSSMKESPKIEETEKLQNMKLNGDLKGLDGCCNKTFTQLGGVLSKTMPLKYVEKSLYGFNKLLNAPMPYKDIKSMMWQIKRYRNYDKSELVEEVLEHLGIVGQSTSRDLQASLAHEKKDIEEVLKYLIDDDKVIKNRNIYKIIHKVEWEEDFMKISKPLPFAVPYFDNYARFSDGTMIIIGASSGHGKTNLACNFLERFVKQGQYPYLLSTEADSKFGIVSASLGLKVGDFGFKLVSDPTSVELKENAITVIDWISAGSEGDYSKMETIYKRLSEQLQKHKGLLIVFAQLKRDTNQFYAQNMTEFYASLVAKYNWTPIKNNKGEIYDYDNIHTEFHTEKIRDSKNGKQYMSIPTHFDMASKRLTLRGNKIA